MFYLSEKEVDDALASYSCLFDWEEHDAKIRKDAIEEFCNGIELDTPMHFTKEQSEWIKKYVILKRYEAIEEFVKEFEKSIKSEIRVERWWTDVVKTQMIAEKLKGDAENG